MYRVPIALIFAVLVSFGCSDPSEDAPECAPETDEQLCSDAGATCGTLSVTDRCDAARTLSCGLCADGESCQDNVCACVAKPEQRICNDSNVDCGMFTTSECGASRTVDCGVCPSGSSCGAVTPNVCGCPCLIDQRCYPEGAENPSNPCLRCLPSVSENSWSGAANETCDDDNRCTTGDTCDANGLCRGETVDCPDGVDRCQVERCDPTDGLCKPQDADDGAMCDADAFSCTDDLCVAGVCTHATAPQRCLIDGSCYVTGETDAANDCAVCDPTLATDAFSDGNATSCDDGDGLDCTAGVCNQGVCSPQTAPAFCTINGACVLRGDRDPTNECAECDPARDPFAYSPLDAITCTDSDNLDCTSGVCSNGACNAIRLPDWCIINGVCAVSGATPQGPAGYCQYCNPQLDPTAWTLLNGPTCGQNGLCSCQAGVCRNGNQLCL